MLSQIVCKSILSRFGLKPFSLVSLPIEIEDHKVPHFKAPMNGKVDYSEVPNKRTYPNNHTYQNFYEKLIRAVWPSYSPVRLKLNKARLMY